MYLEKIIPLVEIPSETQELAFYKDTLNIHSSMLETSLKTQE